MLRFLTIKRLAVIDSVQVEFDPGLNVLSGETGAGKSILVEAVGLAPRRARLGRSRQDRRRNGDTSRRSSNIGGQEWLVRREITAQGRSRAFINGDLTTAGALKELANRLIELHGQHEHQTLLDPTTHLAALDAFAGLEPVRHRRWRRFHRAPECDAGIGGACVARYRERDARLEFAAFQLAELDKADLKPAEDEELSALKQVLSSAERIERLCEDSYATLYEQDGAVLAGLSGVWRKVGELAAIDPVFQPYLEARDSIKSQLEELALHLRRYADSIEASPARLQHVEDRLALLDRLKRKHGPSLADVIARREALRSEVSDLEAGSDRLVALEAVKQKAALAYLAVATELSDCRRTGAREFARTMERLLGGAGN
ncbi:MAG: AAA family ATPase [Vicinamibacterales bacterium]